MNDAPVYSIETINATKKAAIVSRASRAGTACPHLSFLLPDYQRKDNVTQQYLRQFDVDEGVL